MRVAVVLGTRPEIVKLSPIIRELERRTLDYFVLHTGQHYSYLMDSIFFRELALPKPDYNLKVGSGTHAEETGKMLIGIEKVLRTERPDVVLVEGDTNTVLAGALASSKLMMKVGHVEAGLRSFDRSMPEETNRVVADHVSDYLFAPTQTARTNLLRENIDGDRIFLTGNTIVDAVFQNMELATKIGGQRQLAGIQDFILVTLHRQENVDDPVRLRNIMEAIRLVLNELKMTMIYPVHPRTRKRLLQQRVRMNNDRLKLVSPLGYLSFLNLERKARLIITDSGGVQEEACILKVPCVTMRDNTERPETVEVGANMLAGTKPDGVLKKAKIMLGTKRNWRNPFGDGRAAVKIVRILASRSSSSIS